MQHIPILIRTPNPESSVSEDKLSWRPKLTKGEMMNSLRFSVILLVILIFPVDGPLGDNRYETCADLDSDNYDSIPLSSYKNYYKICKIGYIEGKVSIGWQIEGTDTDFISISILNNANVNKFIGGEAYGHSNTDLASLTFEMGQMSSGTRAEYTEVDLIGDNYYLVINLGYRNAYDSQEVTEKSRTELFGLWYGDRSTENDNQIQRLYYSVDLDYT